MEHREAVESGAVPRYLLAEMSEAECRAFEAHYFDCRECLEAVEAGAVLAANAPAGFAGEERQPRTFWRALFVPALAFSTCLLLLALGWEELVRVPALKTHFAAITAPRAYPVTFLRAVTRSGDQVVSVDKASATFGLTLDVPPDDPSPAWNCRLDDASGRTQWRIQVRRPSVPGEPLNLLVPASLAPGRYTLVLSPVSGGVGHEFPFELRIP